MKIINQSNLCAIGAVTLVAALAMSATAYADHFGDGPSAQHAEQADSGALLQRRGDPHAAIAAHDEATEGMVISDGPFADVVKNLSLAGRGERLVPDATTDVWTLGKFAYVGTFNSPCGDGTGENGSGISIFDVHNPNMVGDEVGNIPSVAGSRTNDVKVATMGSGDILVHSNESCGGGPGGFEIWNVDEPTAPIHLASVQTDDVNGLLRDDLGFVDFGVHNLFLFTQDHKDYAAAVVGSEFGNFQIFDITDPFNPVLVGFWGAESLLFPAVDFATTTDFGGVILPADAFLFSGFGASTNRFLHDVTISADGTRAYLSNWDAGLVLLDISDVTDPSLVSVALNVADGSLDGEVNSHAAWPSEDGSIVVEGEEDFSAFEDIFEITSGPDAGEYPAAEGLFTTPIISLPGGEMAGPTTYVGLGCSTVVAAPTLDTIALIQRGDCLFDLKATNAIDAGYAGMVVFNDAARGDSLVSMVGDARALPGVFVGHSTGLKTAVAATAGDLVIGAAGESVSASTAVPNAWSGLRIWDYSDPANPVLASTFNTVCSADPIDISCDPRGTYSAHNVIVETTDQGQVKAYISWYTDGVVVIDVTDPYHPEEVGRFHREGTEFEEENGGIQDVWGIYKVPGQPWIYASDRNGGLYVLKEYGSGSRKVGRK